MSSFYCDINQVFKKLKKVRGENTSSSQIPHIETLDGVYTGIDVLEGFRKNTEIICNDKETNTDDHTFHKECLFDDTILVDIANYEQPSIPEMTLENLKFILFSKLKPNKACDIYRLTIEHLRYCGDRTLTLILQLINLIIRDLSCLSSSHLNTSIASIIHKGKGKSVTHHKSYRQVRVTPLIARIIDEHLRPNLVNISSTVQNSSQYGFT